VTRNQILACGMAIAVLAVIAVMQRRPADAGDQGPQRILPEGSVQLTDVGAIELWREGRDGEAGTLTLQDGRWHLTSRDDAPASRESVERLLGMLDGLVGQARVDDAAMLPEFQLAGDGAIHLRLAGLGGDELLHLRIGKKGPRSNQAFVCPEGDTRAWLADAGLHSALGIHGQGDRPFDADFFLERHLFPQYPEAVERLAVEGLEEWAVVRVEGVWQRDPEAAGPPPQDRNATGRAHSFTRARADGLVGRGEPAQYGLAEPLGTASMTIHGQAHTLLVGLPVPDDPDAERARDEHYVAVEGSDLVWRMRRGVIDSLFRPLE